MCYVSVVVKMGVRSCQSEGCLRTGGIFPDVLVIPGCAPWMQISSLTSLASTQHGNTLRIENVLSISWKLLRSSSWHAHDDDDNDDEGRNANDTYIHSLITCSTVKHRLNQRYGQSLVGRMLGNEGVK